MADLARVSTRAVAPIIAALRARGVEPDGALRRVGLELAEVTDPDGMVPHDRVVELWTVASELTDPTIGLQVSASIPRGQFGVVEFGLRKSATVLAGLRRVDRYFRIGHDVARFDVEVDGDRVVCTHSLPGARRLPRAAADFVRSNPILVVRDATGGAVDPLEVYVDYPRPADTAPIEDQFRAPIVYDSDRRSIVYSAEAAATPLAQYEPGLCKILDQHAAELLARVPTVGRFGDRVRELLADELAGGDTTAQQVARTLKMSVRTLHRRLQEEGTSHKQLLDELRRDLAADYLRERSVAVAEVAFLLGFSEPSAFHRAFRRWTGQTPTQFRAAGAG